MWVEPREGRFPARWRAFARSRYLCPSRACSARPAWFQLLRAALRSCKPRANEPCVRRDAGARVWWPSLCKALALPCKRHANIGEPSHFAGLGHAPSRGDGPKPAHGEPLPEHTFTPTQKPGAHNVPPSGPRAASPTQDGRKRPHPPEWAPSGRALVPPSPRPQNSSPQSPCAARPCEAL